MSLDKGLTVLTGETGAGKSIIINAVNLILGSRASPELIRTSEEAAELEALFEVPPGSPAAAMAHKHGFDLSEGLVVRRVIQRRGRHKVYVNGRLSTTQILSGINHHLASIAGQHAHQMLLKPEYHLFVLDHSAGLEGLRQEVADMYHKILPLIRRLTSLKEEAKGQSARRELLEFQSGEIEQAQIRPGEDKALEQEMQRLKNAERLYENVSLCLDQLYGGEGTIVEGVTGIERELQALAKIDQCLTPLQKRVEGVCYELEDIATELRNYLQGLVFDPEALEEAGLRLDTLQKLKRKYGGTLESVTACRKEIETELERASSLPQAIVDLESELAELHYTLTGLCQRLSEKRREAASRFAERVQEELASLGMPKTRFEVNLEGVPADGAPNPYLAAGHRKIEDTGTDRAEFFIAPNVGEALKPLARIASGGELSRIILGLKAILADKASVETLIFDEVDAGIGGAVAEMVGKKLASLSRFHQVLCITHLPQIARFGRQHYKIAKTVSKGRTRTNISRLEGNERVEEMARMLGGMEITGRVMAHAREMIGNATGQGNTERKA
jgi:DNA repair protein RecN (Recombination protein N)